MDINALAATAAGSKAAGAGSRLAETFDTFLTLLTAQLKNQDPLKPMDSTEFTSQLVQFSGVEQSIQQNKNLETLIGLQRANAAGAAVSYLGREVDAATPTAGLENGAARWRYALEASSAETTLTVTNAAGRVVRVLPGERAAGVHELAWDGKDAAGAQLPDGLYTLSLTARTQAGDKIVTDVGVRGRVTQIDMTGAEPRLLIGINPLPLDRIRSVIAPPA